MGRSLLTDVVRQLGEEVEEAWGRTDYATNAFAPIATKAVEGYALDEQFDLDEFRDWLSTADKLPEQRDPASRLGNPAITLWRNSRFVIDIYFWIDRPDSMTTASSAPSPTSPARACIASTAWVRSQNPRPACS